MSRGAPEGTDRAPRRRDQVGLAARKPAGGNAVPAQGAPKRDRPRAKTPMNRRKSALRRRATPKLSGSVTRRVRCSVSWSATIGYAVTVSVLLKPSHTSRRSGPTSASSSGLAERRLIGPWPARGRGWRRGGARQCAGVPRRRQHPHAPVIGPGSGRACTCRETGSREVPVGSQSLDERGQCVGDLLGCEGMGSVEPWARRCRSAGRRRPPRPRTLQRPREETGHGLPRDHRERTRQAPAQVSVEQRHSRRGCVPHRGSFAGPVQGW